MIKDRVKRFIDQHMIDVTVVTMILALLIAALWPSMAYTIPAGHVGVLWLRFAGGTVTDGARLRGEGMTVIFPWDKLFVYDARMRYVTETYDAISADGMEIQATVSVRFRLNRDLIGLLHRDVGEDYVNNLLLPEIGSHVRTQIAHYSAEQVYSTERDTIQTSLAGYVNQRLSSNPGMGGEGRTFLAVNDVLIRGIQLPPVIVAAINRKIEQFYANQEYDFRLLREAKEAERRRIEGQGIQQFQQIVSQGISESYLRWRGIEATLQLAQSQNAKVVIIGGADGLPLILNLPGEANAVPGGAGLAAESGASAAAPLAVAPGAGITSVPLPNIPGTGLPGTGSNSLPPPAAAPASGGGGPAAPAPTGAAVPSAAMPSPAATAVTQAGPTGPAAAPGAGDQPPAGRAP